MLTSTFTRRKPIPHMRPLVVVCSTVHYYYYYCFRSCTQEVSAANVEKRQEQLPQQQEVRAPSPRRHAHSFTQSEEK